MDLYSIGECVIDFLPGSAPGSYIRNAGGAPANVAIAAARNGLDVGFCGKVGDDDFGRFLQDTLSENKVHVLCGEPTHEAVTTMAFVTLTATGERSFTFARKPGADMLLCANEVNDDDLRQATVVHGGSCSLSKGSAAEATVRALRRGHELGKLVSFDVNYRDPMWDSDRDEAKRRIGEILPFIDLLKVSEEEVALLGGESHLPTLAKEFEIAVVVETMGEQGARCFFSGDTLYASALSAVCVDTTGAGDAFWGGFLSRLLLSGVRSTADLTRDLLLSALQYGSVAGGLAVQKKGAIPSLPTLSEIESALCHQKELTI